MNQLDWEKMKENIKITDVTRVSPWFVTQSEYRINVGRRISGTYTGTQIVDSSYEKFAEATSGAPSYYPSRYVLGGSTSWVSGSVSDLTSDNGVYMAFRSYSSGTDTSDFVDNNISDVDSSADKGTHSNFSAQRAGPDSTYDTLTEGNTGSASNMTLINAESFEGTWPPMGWTETNDWNKESDQAYNGIYSAYFDGSLFYSSGDLDTPNLDCSGANAIYVDFWYRDDDLDTNDFLLRYYDGSNWDTVSDLGSTTQEDQWLHYQQKITDSQYFVSTFMVRWSGVSVYSGESAWVDYVTIKKEVGTYNYELDLEVQWTNVDYDETNEELAIYVHKGNNTHSLDATGGYMIIGNGTPNWGSVMGTISFWIKWDTVANRPWGQHDNMETRFSGTNLVLDWGAAGSLTSSTSFTAGKWYFIAIVWNENTDKLYLYVGDKNNSPTLDAQNNAWTSTVSTVGVTQNNFMASKGGVNPTDGHGDELRYWNIDRTSAEIQSDHDAELTGSETNLRSCFKLNNNFDDIGPNNNDGSGSGSYSFSSDVPFDAPPTENIRVDVWYNGSWQNLITDLTIGWNNASVSSYLDSSTFTIRFKGGTETGDTTQDKWKIDVTLLHVWSGEYTIEFEFVGSSNTEDWTELTWTIDSAWTSDSVSVTLQLYNYTLGNYPTRGDGYISYLASSANTDETQSQTITQDPTDFRNATGYWKMKVKGVKVTDTSFDFNADWVELSPVVSYADYQLDLNGAFTIDLSTYPLAYIQTVEIQLRYMANDTVENWYLKAYNWTDATFSDSGFNSTAGHMPTSGWDYYAANLTDQWRSYVKEDGAMYIKLHDEGPDSNQTTIDIDFLGVRALLDGTLLVFENEGAMTTHLVSLWVISSTIHQRYDISIFINSGETFSYLLADTRLPDGPYVVKVVTERGNIAVYSEG